VGIEDPVAFADRLRTEAENGGHWRGTALELWLALFMEHRRDHFGGPVGISIEIEPPTILDELCRSLTISLRSMRR